jgi:Mor family transcriptional regulator
MFNNLPKQNDKIIFQANDQKRNLFDALPQEFTRKQAVELSKSYRISIRSVDDILRAAVGKTLTKIKSGLYQKI